MDPVRREVLRIAAVALAAAPAWGLTQTGGPARKRVAIGLGPSNLPDPIGPAKQAWGRRLAKHGLLDGKDIEIEIFRGTKRNYLSEGAADWEAVARKVVTSRPDLIVMQGAWLPFIRPLTDRIPIVFFGGANDPAQYGDLGIDSLRRPGRNVTGVDLYPVEREGKVLEMLKELRPDARRHAIVGLADPRWADRVMAMARGLGLEAAVFTTNIEPRASEVADALRTARIDMASFLWGSNDRDLHEALVKLRVAAAFPLRSSVEAGGLLSVAPKGDFLALVASLAARILRGERVGSIPIEQPREVHVAINLRTAKALGIAVPASILLRATEVFE